MVFPRCLLNRGQTRSAGQSPMRNGARRGRSCRVAQPTRRECHRCAALYPEEISNRRTRGDFFPGVHPHVGQKAPGGGVPDIEKIKILAAEHLHPVPLVPIWSVNDPRSRTGGLAPCVGFATHGASPPVLRKNHFWKLSKPGIGYIRLK